MLKIISSFEHIGNFGGKVLVFNTKIKWVENSSKAYKAKANQNIPIDDIHIPK